MRNTLPPMLQSFSSLVEHGNTLLVRAWAQVARYPGPPSVPPGLEMDLQAKHIMFGSTAVSVKWGRPWKRWATVVGFHGLPSSIATQNACCNHPVHHVHAVITMQNACSAASLCSNAHSKACSNAALVMYSHLHVHHMLYCCRGRYISCNSMACSSAVMGPVSLAVQVWLHQSVSLATLPSRVTTEVAPQLSSLVSMMKQIRSSSGIRGKMRQIKSYEDMDRCMYADYSQLEMGEP
eukprot:318395-Pelagomonas_calceolata.AAC.9